MNRLLNRDLPLAKGPDGSVTVAVPVGDVHPEALDQFVSHGFREGQAHILAGRSASAITLALGVQQADRPSMVENNTLYIPTLLIARNKKVGVPVVDILHDSVDRASDGQLATILSHNLPIGPVDKVDDSEQIDDPDELEYMIRQGLVGATAQGRRLRVHNDKVHGHTVAMEISPVKLVPKRNMATEENVVRMLHGGRREALDTDTIDIQVQTPGQQFDDWTVTRAGFGPGMQECQVLGVQTEQGFLPQDEGASRLHAGRFMGANGHEIEVSKPAGETHYFGGAEVLIAVNKNKRIAQNGAASRLWNWYALSPGEREAMHMHGHNIAEAVEQFAGGLVELVGQYQNGVLITPKELIAIEEGTSVATVIKARHQQPAIQDQPAHIASLQAELKIMGNDPCVWATRNYSIREIADIVDATNGSLEMILITDPEAAIDHNDTDALQRLTASNKVIRAYRNGVLETIDSKTDEEPNA